MSIPPSQAQQDTTEKEKVQSFFGLSLFYAAQILNGAVALFLLYTDVYSKKGCLMGKYECALNPLKVVCCPKIVTNAQKQRKHF